MRDRMATSAGLYDIVSTSETRLALGRVMRPKTVDSRRECQPNIALTRAYTFSTCLLSTTIRCLPSSHILSFPLATYTVMSSSKYTTSRPATVVRPPATRLGESTSREKARDAGER